MPLQFNCPSCQRVIGAEVAPGTQVRCPLCGQVVTVPGAMGPPPMPETLQYGNPEDTARAGLAIGALVCGIVGLAVCMPVGIVGLVLGIVALVKIGRYPSQYRGKGMAIAGVCTGALSILMLPVLMAVFVPAIGVTRETAKRTVCTANLRGIGQSLYIYAQDEPKGMFPEAGADWMGRLIQAGYCTPKHFVCPSTTDMPGDCSYVYVPGYGTTSSPQQIIVYERLQNHGEGGNILYQDGHVNFVQSPQFEQAIAAIKLPNGTPFKEGAAVKAVKEKDEEEEGDENEDENEDEDEGKDEEKGEEKGDY